MEFSRHLIVLSSQRLQWKVTRLIEDPLVLRDLDFCQNFRTRVERTRDEKFILLSTLGQTCHGWHARPFLIASRRCTFVGNIKVIQARWLHIVQMTEYYYSYPIGASQLSSHAWIDEVYICPPATHLFLCSVGYYQFQRLANPLSKCLYSSDTSDIPHDNLFLAQQLLTSPTHCSTASRLTGFHRRKTSIHGEA